MWEKFRDIVSQNQTFLLTTHLYPDGDGVGSACALVEWLRMKGKEVHFVTDRPLPEKWHFLDTQGAFRHYEEISNWDHYQAIIILDAHTEERIGRLSTLLEDPSCISICIDHHASPEETCVQHALIDPSACACGALVYQLFQEEDLFLNLSAAMGVYVSILCDTGRFCYSSTSSQAHQIASECVHVGVDPDAIYSLLFQHLSMAEIQLFARALQRMETFFDGKIIVQKVLKEDCLEVMGSDGDLEQVDWDYIHNFNNWIEDVQCVVLLRELQEERIRVSVRSAATFDVGKAMQQLGGGGHGRAAGVILRGSMEFAEKQVLSALCAPPEKLALYQELS